MNGDTHRSCSVAVRLTEDEKLAINARAACTGEAPSAYIRRILLGHASRALPNLAAAAELLAICQTLVDAVESSERVPRELKEFAGQRAEMVFEILRQHGHRGTLP